MMHSVLNTDLKKYWAIAIASILCFVSGIYFEQIILVALPFIAIVGAFLVSDFRLGFFLMIVSIPFTSRIGELGALNIEMPDEGLMLFLTALFPFFWMLNRENNKYIFPYLKHPLTIVLAICFVWTLLSTIFSEQVGLSFKYTLKRVWFLIPFLVLPFYFFQDKHFLTRIIQCLLVVSFFIILIVTYRHSLLGFSFEKNHGPLQPFFLNHVLYGSYVSCLAPIALLSIWLSKRWSFQWLFSIGLSALVLVAVYFSYSRGAWAALLFGGFMYVLLRLKLAHWFMTGFYALLMLAIFWLHTNNRYLSLKPDFEKTKMHETLEDHILATIRGTDISSAERYYRWIAALHMWQDRPLLGVGPNNFYDYYKSYTVKSFKTWVSRNEERSTTHNYFLYLLVEQGFPAMLGYAIFIWLFFFYAQHTFYILSERREKIIVAIATCVMAVFFINNFFSELVETEKLGSLYLMSTALIIIYHTKALKLKNNKH
ncbi:MAG: O-antigen ligase family protein [Chitinophagaceae bacterium]